MDDPSIIWINDPSTIQVTTPTKYTNFKYMTYIAILMYGGGGGGSVAYPTKGNIPAGGGGSGAYIQLGIDVKLSDGSTLTSLDVTSIGGGGGCNTDGGDTTVILTYSDGNTYEYTAGGGKAPTNNSSVGGAGGKCSIPDPSVQNSNPSGTLLNPLDGADGGSAGYNGTGNGYTTSGSGSTADCAQFAGKPPYYSINYGTGELNFQGSGLNNTPSGYGSGGGGTPSGYKLNGVNVETQCLTGISGACFLQVM